MAMISMILLSIAAAEDDAWVDPESTFFPIGRSIRGSQEGNGLAETLLNTLVSSLSGDEDQN